MTKQKKFRFEPSDEGLVKFLEEFQYFWKILCLVFNGPVGHTPRVKEFEEKKGALLHFCGRILNGDINTHELTISTGVVLMKEIEDFIEDLVDSARVTQMFEDTSRRIKTISPNAWSSREEEAQSVFDHFLKISEGDDLEEAVLAYNELASTLDSITSSARAEETERKREEEERKKVTRLKKVREKGREILALLSA